MDVQWQEPMGILDTGLCPVLGFGSRGLRFVRNEVMGLESRESEGSNALSQSRHADVEWVVAEGHWLFAGWGVGEVA